MDELGFLRDLVIVFGVAVLVVGALRRIGIPSIAGFILSGALVGPDALRLVGEVREVEALAEIGVVLLLFGIGLELSLARLRRLWRPVLIGGTLQVGLTIAASAAVGRMFGLGGRSALFVGFVLAVSSTAIVLRSLRVRGELDAPHGQMTLGILVFQDLCVVPMMLAIPLLAGGPGSTAGAVGQLLRAVVVLAAVFVLSRVVVPPLLHAVARTRQRELFVLVVLVVCLGIAWIVSVTGASLALGAFLAGLTVADSEYRHQALADLIPFREVLTSLFFVSVGMLLDPSRLLLDIGPVLGLVAALVLGKFALVIVVGLIMRLPLRVAILTGVALAQAGEFSFILMRAAEATPLLPQGLPETLRAAVIVSMLATPLVLAAGPRLAARAGRVRVLSRLRPVRMAEDLAVEGARLAGHVVIAGYGLTGQELARALRSHRIPYIVVDFNTANVQRASQRGEIACFGDITRTEVLEALGVDRARELVVAINDPHATEGAVRAARRLAPELRILARVPFLADVEGMLEAGATEVVTAELEAAVEVTASLLGRHGIGDAELAGHLERIRGLRRE